MGKPLIQFLAEAEKACCQYGFMQKFRMLTNKGAAAKIGVSERTVSETRSMINNGGIACRKCPNCTLKERK